jgi:integrase
MFIIAPEGRKLKHGLRFRNHDGKVVRVSAERNLADTERLALRIEMLLKSKHNGDQPPKELQVWIDNMASGLADRLAELGLIERQRLQRNTPIDDLIEKYEKILRDKKSKRKNHRGNDGLRQHPKKQADRVRIVCKALNIKKYEDFDPDKFLEFFEQRDDASNTRRGYIILMNNFAKQMIRCKFAKINPFADIEKPGLDEDVVYERQPMTVVEFQKLTAYLDTMNRYFGQKARWDAHDRKIIYWTAVKTAYRQSEMKRLHVWNLSLDSTPPVIFLKAGSTKNGRVGEVPIPDDLAAALKEYIIGKEPTDVLFPFPSTSGSIVDMLRRDFEGAGIVWKLPSGEVMDFHSLRSTAICWWLDEDKLPPKRVQILARLSTLHLVYRYSRNLRIGDFSWLNQGPKLVKDNTEKKVG